MNKDKLKTAGITLGFAVICNAAWILWVDYPLAKADIRVHDEKFNSFEKIMVEVKDEIKGLRKDINNIN